MGREQGHQHVENYIYIQNPKVSRQHLKIELGQCDIQDLELKTPLQIHFESRKPTEVNGLLYKPSKNDEPLIKPFSNEALTVRFKGTESRIDLKWCSFNVVAHAGKIAYENEVTTSPLPQKLRLLFERGIDLRITSDINKATHYVTHSDHPNWPFRIALLAGIPILNSFWVDFVFDNRNRVEEWFVNIADDRFLPSSQHGKRYLFPNAGRKSLLKAMHVILLSSKDHAKYEKWIHSMGAKAAVLEPQNYIKGDIIDEKRLIEDMRGAFQSLSTTSAFFMRTTTKEENDSLIDKKLAEICKAHNGDLVNEHQLLEAVKNVSTGNLHAISSIKKRPAVETLQAPVEGKPVLKRRRKFERIGANDLLDFQLASLQGSLYPSATQTYEKEDPVTEKGVSRDATPSATITTDTPLKSPTVAPREQKDEDAEPQIPTSKDPGSQHEEDCTFQERKDDISEATRNEEPKAKKIKPQSKIPKFVPAVSLIDALKSTKQQATESIKRELGIDGDSYASFLDSLGEKLGDLAIVETVEMVLRKAPPESDSSSRYKGRKNFKSFKKNLPVKSNMTRSFIDVEAVKIDNEVQFISSYKGQNKMAYAEAENAQKKLSTDFRGVMDDVRGFVPPTSTSVNEENVPDEDSFSFKSREQSLFVADDESQPTLRSVNVDYKAVDEEDDSDDDQPRFTFRRS